MTSMVSPSIDQSVETWNFLVVCDALRKTQNLAGSWFLSFLLCFLRLVLVKSGSCKISEVFCRLSEGVSLPVELHSQQQMDLKEVYGIRLTPGGRFFFYFLLSKKKKIFHLVIWARLQPRKGGMRYQVLPSGGSTMVKRKSVGLNHLILYKSLPEIVVFLLGLFF